MKSGSVLFIVIFSVIFLIYLTPKLLHVRKLENRSQKLETELQKIKKENKALEYELRLLREDPVYLEKVARDKFHRAKEGEIVYKVVREK